MSRQQPSSQSQSYQRYTVGVILGPMAELLVRSAQLGPGERVLDLACGTGAASRPVARAVGATGRVTALDLDADCLAVARQTPQDKGARIRWLQGDVGALPFPDAVFDAVFCSQGLQFFSDRVTALQEVSRVLASEGRFAACVWQARERNPYYQALKEAIDPHLDARTAAMMEAPFVLADPAALRKPFIEAGLDVQIEPLSVSLPLPALEGFIPGHISGMSVAKELSRLSDTAIQEVKASVSCALRAYHDEQGLRVPFAVHVALARRGPTPP